MRVEFDLASSDDEHLSEGELDELNSSMDSTYLDDQYGKAMETSKKRENEQHEDKQESRLEEIEKQLSQLEVVKEQPLEELNDKGLYNAF